MGLVVQKYGGSSVADADSVKRVAARIVETKKAGNDVVVIVSAMGDTTDDLIDLAERVSPKPAARELDMLLTAGERMSAALLACPSPSSEDAFPHQRRPSNRPLMASPQPLRRWR